MGFLEALLSKVFMIPQIFVDYAKKYNLHVLSKKGQFLGNLRLSPCTTENEPTIYRCLGTIYENGVESPKIVENVYLLPGEFNPNETDRL